MSVTPWLSDIEKILSMAADINEVNDGICQRVAFIITDQALELDARTFLRYHINLVPSVISRREWENNQHRFPFLLDNIEQHCTRLRAKILRQWKFHHHTRNSLYHNPLPLSIDPEKVDEFITFAYKFCKTLFRKKLKGSEEPFWEARHEYLEWDVSDLPSLPRHSSKPLIHFTLKFIVKNISDESVLVKILVRSTSQAIGFRQIPPKRVGIIRKKEVNLALDSVISQAVGAQQEGVFTFPAFYRPFMTNPLALLEVIEYGIIVLDDEGEEVMNTGPFRLEIPIEEEKT